HGHGDHNNIAAVKGNPQAIKGAVSTTIKGIAIKGISAYHDDVEGKKSGSNTIFCFTVDGMKVCHLGDLGHKLTDAQLAEIGEVDVLLTPMAGNYTIDAATATELMNKVRAKVAIPMHYRNPLCDYPVATVDEFIKGKNNVASLDACEVEFKKGQLPDNQIMVLKPAP
ncbi:MAG: MBL fold metallo-hydrolase, partial [Chloroflexota bacterium]